MKKDFISSSRSEILSRNTANPVFLVFVWMWLAAAGRAEIIDRIVAIMDSHVITASDLRQERKVRSTLGETSPADDKELLQEVIDDYFIQTQLTDFPGIDVTDAEIDAYLKPAGTESQRDESVRDAVRKRIRRDKYFDARFRQFIHPSDEEIRKYYDDVFVPKARTRGAVPPLPQIVEQIRNAVLTESLNHEVNIWLDAIRRRSDIEVFE